MTLLTSPSRPHDPAQQRSVAPTQSRDFTLLELLVVILIIGLLTGIVGPRLLGQVGRSEVTAARAQINAIDKGLQAYRFDMGRFPDSAQGLSALMRPPSSGPEAARWRGPYLQDEVPLDPWGHPYEYRLPGRNGRDFDLMSLGRDGAIGGSGDDADIYR